VKVPQEGLPLRKVQVEVRGRKLQDILRGCVAQQAGESRIALEKLALLGASVESSGAALKEVLVASLRGTLRGFLARKKRCYVLCGERADARKDDSDASNGCDQDAVHVARDSAQRAGELGLQRCEPSIELLELDAKAIALHGWQRADQETVANAGAEGTKVVDGLVGLSPGDDGMVNLGK
jgi:hypothetical protein